MGNRSLKTMCYLVEFLLSLFFLSFALISTASAATFHVRNNCPYTLWAAATPTGGGRRLESGQNWTLNVPAAGTSVGRIWARTKCDFDASGKGHCQTGDCGGVLQCKGWGTPPNTLAEYALNQFGNMDFYDISLVDGFNVPIKFSPTSTAPTRCKPASCAADINSQCPTELKAPGGCNNPCTVFNTSEYCCTAGQGSCGPTRFSSFFRHMCPDAYSYPLDDQASTFTCPSGTDYGVVFCPSRSLTHFPVESVAEELMKQ